MVWVRLGSILMFIGVALGAFGAHGLREKLSFESKQIYQTAVLYHFIHALGLLAVGWLATLKPINFFVKCAGGAFVIGIFLFSGSLYLLSVTQIKKFGIITPFGGIAFLAGWLFLALATR